MEAWRSGGKGIFHQAMLSLRERARGKTEGRAEGCAAGCGQRGRKGMKLKVGGTGGRGDGERHTLEVAKRRKGKGALERWIEGRVGGETERG